MNKNTNRLAQEKSPYLLQHAHNPVEWFPWGDEAFAKAKQEDKPIFLSIGYSTCHWCHVMERESFEDEEVASLLNKYFVSIKVDREERPDLDSIYMIFCQALTGSGGWPLTLLITPKKIPFYAGTYFPKQSKYGRPGLLDILTKANEMWQEKRHELEKSSQDLYQMVAESIEISDVSDINSSNEIIHKTFNILSTLYDPWYGGFGQAPKFPTPHNLSFLLRYFCATGEKKALEMVEKTLEHLYKGGIFDHIGYGFSRYSTDEKWLVPHFEKMLYDNALLAICYLETYQITGKERYKDVANKIFTYVLRDMTSPEGGFYCAEDADSEGIEGKFYVWEPEEIIEVLGEKNGLIFCKYYDIKIGGNFADKSIPNLLHTSLDDIKNNPELARKLQSCRELLFEYRLKRIPPHKDDKILTAWNGLMIASLAMGGRTLNNTSYLHAAKKAYSFIVKNLIREDGRILARFREGEAANLGIIDDYAFLVWGLIELYEATYETAFLQDALRINEDMLSLFADEKNGGLYITGQDGEKLILRPKNSYDGAIPSGNSVAVLNMLRLAKITENQTLIEKARFHLDAFKGSISDNPNAYTFYLMAYLFANITTKAVVLVGELEDDTMKEMMQNINSNFLPFTTFVVKHKSASLSQLIPSVKAKKQHDHQATAYICENFTCHLPTTDAHKLISYLKNETCLN